MGEGNTCSGTNRTLMLLSFDIVLFLAVTFGFMAAHYYGKPVRRGFFCADDSIRYPFVEQTTVPSTLLMGSGLTLPLIVMLGLEICHATKSNKRSYATTVSKRLGKVYFLFLCGWMTTICISEVVKLAGGRLRPHFVEACQPDWNNIDCTQGYITNFTCTNEFVTASELTDARKSFPSGHAASAAFTCLYCAFYLHCRLKSFESFSVLIRFTVHAVLALVAILVAQLRVMDYMHHVTDVIAGALLGVVMATFTIAYHLSDLRFLFDKPTATSQEQEPLEESSGLESACDMKHPQSV